MNWYSTYTPINHFDPTVDVFVYVYGDKVKIWEHCIIDDIKGTVYLN